MADTEPEATTADDPTEATIQAADNPDAVRSLIASERQAAKDAGPRPPKQSSRSSV